LSDKTAQEEEQAMLGSRKVLVFSGSSTDFELLDEKRIVALVDELRKNLEDFMACLQDIPTGG